MTKSCCQLPEKQSFHEHAKQLSASEGHIQVPMISLAANTFMMGAEDGPYPLDGEGPTRPVHLSAYRLANTSITNQQFSVFIEHTGYVTEAERFGFSFVFQNLLSDAQSYPEAAMQSPWWRKVEGACWHQPEGHGSSVQDRLQHPVVQVSWRDAMMYCQWSGTRLPTEAEWEYAARGGLQSEPFPWGKELLLKGKHRANVWQGEFPNHNSADDGYTATCPVDAFEANDLGFYNMIGNVWEWTWDRFTRHHSPNPQTNPTGPLNGAQRVAKGGSFLCHASYCQRYRTSSRHPFSPASTSSNIGFRVAAL